MAVNDCTSKSAVKCRNELKSRLKQQQTAK